jgi:hypothetical protein
MIQPYRYDDPIPHDGPSGIGASSEPVEDGLQIHSESANIRPMAWDFSEGRHTYLFFNDKYPPGTGNINLIGTLNLGNHGVLATSALESTATDTFELSTHMAGVGIQND